MKRGKFLKVFNSKFGKTKVSSAGEICFLPQGARSPASPGESVLEVALRCGIEIGHSCGGMGSCTTCRVFVVEGAEQLGRRTEMELERAEERVFAENERLSCQIPALPGLKIKIP